MIRPNACALAFFLLAGNTVMAETTWYDFRFGETNAGYVAVHDSGSEIRMDAEFEMGGKRYSNPFAFRYDGPRVTAYRAGDGDWISMEGRPETMYPTSAYPLLIRHGIRIYTALHEGTGEPLGPTTLAEEEGWLVERRDGRLVRRFRLVDGAIVEIDWGGPVSRRCGSKAEAVAGSSLED